MPLAKYRIYFRSKERSSHRYPLYRQAIMPPQTTKALIGHGAQHYLNPGICHTWPRHLCFNEIDPFYASQGET